MPELLVPYDGSVSSYRAIQHVIEICQEIEPAQVDLLNVQEALGWREVLFEDRPSEMRELEELRLARGTELLQTACDMLREAGIAHTCEVVVGEPAPAIGEHANHHRYDLIVMGTRGMGALGNLTMGSVATKVIRLADTPVTLVK